MNTALFVQDRKLEGNDFLFYNGNNLSKDDPLRGKVFSKLAFPKGIHIYKSDHLDIYSGLKNININTCLSNEIVDIQNRRIPIMFFTTETKHIKVFQLFAQYLVFYGSKVDPETMEEIRKTLEKDEKRKKVISAFCALMIVLGVSLLFI